MLYPHLGYRYNYVVGSEIGQEQLSTGVIIFSVRAGLIDLFTYIKYDEGVIIIMYKYMPKRFSELRTNIKSKHSPKTKKRLEIKRLMLEKKASGKKKK